MENRVTARQRNRGEDRQKCEGGSNESETERQKKQANSGLQQENQRWLSLLWGSLHLFVENTEDIG